MITHSYENLDNIYDYSKKRNKKKFDTNLLNKVLFEKLMEETSYMSKDEGKRFYFSLLRAMIKVLKQYKVVALPKFGTFQLRVEKRGTKFSNTGMEVEGKMLPAMTLKFQIDRNLRAFIREKFSNLIGYNDKDTA